MSGCVTEREGRMVIFKPYWPSEYWLTKKWLGRVDRTRVG